MKNRYRVTYDSVLDDGFLVHKEDGAPCAFRSSKKGPFNSDLPNDIRTVLIQTVESNKSKYSLRLYSEHRKLMNFKTS